MKYMTVFTKHDFIYKMLYVGDGRKKPEKKKQNKKNKKQKIKTKKND